MLLCQFCKEKYVYRDVKVCCRLLLFEYFLLRSYNLHSLNFWPCNTAQKVSKYRVISGPCFPVFGLNTEIYSVNHRIQSEYRKIRTRKKSVFEHFSSSGNVLFTTYIVFRASYSEMWETAFWKIFEKFPKHLSLWNTKEGLLLYICRIRNYWQQNYLE